MKNTNYILELIIAGLGTLTWLLLLFITFIDVNWHNIFELLKKDNVTTLLAIYSVFLLPFVYITGIIADRIVDELFDHLFTTKLIKKHFGEKEKYTKAIARIYYKSESLKANYQYGRMRIRICRVWAFNAFICMITMNLFLFLTFEDFVLLHQYVSPQDINLGKLSFYSSVFFLVSALVAFRAWYTLSEKESIVLKIQNEFLIKEESV